MKESKSHTTLVEPPRPEPTLSPRLGGATAEVDSAVSLTGSDPTNTALPDEASSDPSFADVAALKPAQKKKQSSDSLEKDGGKESDGFVVQRRCLAGRDNRGGLPPGNSASGGRLTLSYNPKPRIIFAALR